MIEATPNLQAEVHVEIQFSGKTFVVLGHLSSITKREAWLKIQALGGSVSNTPRPSSDYFIQGARVSATRQARAEELGFPILSEQEFIDAAAAGLAALEDTREHVELGDAIASFRGLFDGPPSHAIWEKVTALLDECTDAQLEDACRYVESHVSRWPDHRDSARAPAMVLDNHPHFTSREVDPLCDQRVALRPWLRELYQGIESPKFELLRRLNLNAARLTGKVLMHLVQNPSLVNVRELDVGQQNNATQTFYRKLRTSEHLPSLDTLTLRTMSAKHADALCGEHTLEALRWVELSYPETRYEPDELEPIYARLFEATWWSQIEGLDLNVSVQPGLTARGGHVYGALSKASARLPALRHLILGDRDGVEELYDSPLLSQLERLTLHTCQHQSGARLLRHLDGLTDHSIEVLDLSRTTYDLSGRDAYARTNRAAYVECLLGLERLDAYERIVLPKPGEGDSVADLEALEALAADAGVTLTPSPFPS